MIFIFVLKRKKGENMLNYELRRKIIYSKYRNLCPEFDIELKKIKIPTFCSKKEEQ